MPVIRHQRALVNCCAEFLVGRKRLHYCRSDAGGQLALRQKDKQQRQTRDGVPTPTPTLPPKAAADGVFASVFCLSPACCVTRRERKRCDLKGRDGMLPCCYRADISEMIDSAPEFPLRSAEFPLMEGQASLNESAVLV